MYHHDFTQSIMRQRVHEMRAEARAARAARLARRAREYRADRAERVGARPARRTSGHGAAPAR